MPGVSLCIELKKYLLPILFFAVVVYVYRACSPKTKAHYILTAQVNAYNSHNGCPLNLYRIYYRVFRGYMTTDVNSVYLTDSLNFRQYLGVYDEDGERITTECKGDSILVTKVSNSKLKVEPLKNYSLKKLKAQKSFD